MQARNAFRFLAVPLRTAPLLVILTFSVLLWLAQASLFGLPLGLLLFTGLCNYTFALFDSVLNGAAEPPVLSVEMMNPVNAPRSLLLLAVVLVMFFASRAAMYWFGAGFAVLAALICATLLPAMLAVQSVTGMTLQALNLHTGVRLIARLGGDYFIVVAFVITAVVTGAWLLPLASAPRVLGIVVVLYLWLASFCLLGGVLHARGDDLGFEDAWTPERFESDDDIHEERRRTQLVDRIYAEWRGGAQGNAWKTVIAETGDGAEALSRFEWLYERIARWPDPRLANRLAREILPRLLAARRSGEAVDMTRARLRSDPEFRPSAAGDLLQLAALLRDAGDRPTARMLLRDFERFYPNDVARAAVTQLAEQLER